MSNLLSCFPLIVRPRNTHAVVQSSSLQRTQGVASEAEAALLSVGLLDFGLKAVCLNNVKNIFIYIVINVEMDGQGDTWLHKSFQPLQSSCPTVTFESSVQELSPVFYSISCLSKEMPNSCPSLTFMHITVLSCMSLKQLPKVFKLRNAMDLSIKSGCV